MDASKYAPFELSQCTWTGLMNLRFSFVLCWSVFQIRFTSLSTLKQTNVSPHTHWLHERKIPTVSLLKLSFYSTSRSLPSKWCILRNNKMLFLPLPLWWCPSLCLKSPLKRVLHVLRNTFYGQSPRSFSAPLRSLSRSKRPNEVKTVCFTNPLHSILVSAA